MSEMSGLAIESTGDLPLAVTPRIVSLDLNIIIIDILIQKICILIDTVN